MASVVGNLGTGKTLLMTYIAEQYRDETVYSNFTIKLPNIVPIDVYTIGNIKQGIVLIDEAYEWLESRLSGSDVNLYLSRLVFNSRKRGLDVFCSAQLGSSLDIRFRDLANLRFIAVGLARNYSGYIYVVNETRMFFLPINKAVELYKIFDTYEEEEAVRPTVFDIRKLDPKIERISNQIIKKAKKARITRGIVSDLFLRNKWDINLEDYVYNRIRKKVQGIK